MSALKKQGCSVLQIISGGVLYGLGAAVHYAQVMRNYYVMFGKFRRQNARAQST